MKKSFYFLLFVGMVFLNISAFGQKTVVVVQPDEGLNIGALNQAIASATDPGNTIFQLKRGGHYLLNGSISHTGYVLHIRAEAGVGPRPILQPAVDANGASSNHFNPSGNLILEGLYIQAIDELGAIANRQIIVSGNKNRIFIDDCYLDYSNQAFIRLTSIDNTISITNSILRNALRPENPTNGRIIDTRDTPQDTLIIENSTIYNCFASTISTSAGLIKYMKFNHNTVFQSNLTNDMNIAQAFKADITNNVFYGYALRSDSNTHHSLFRVDSIRTIGEYTDAGRYFNISNNNFYNPEEFGDILDEYCPEVLYRFDPADIDHSDTLRYTYSLRKNFFANPNILDTLTVTQPPTLWKFIVAGQVDTTNVFSEELIFKNLPPLNLDYWKFYVENNFSIGSLTPPNAFADEDFTNIGEVTTGAYDFGYNTGSKSAKAAKGGVPLGDPRWAAFTPVLAQDMDVNSNSIKTFPNPFDKTITFGIESAENTSARIVVFDLLGKELTSKQTQLVQGYNSVPVDLSSIDNPGIYFYQVQTVQTGKGITVSYGKLLKK